MSLSHISPELVLPGMLRPTLGMCNHYADVSRWCCRNGRHEDVAALMLHLVRAGHLNEAQQIAVVMLVNKSASALILLVLNHRSSRQALQRTQVIATAHCKLEARVEHATHCHEKACSMLYACSRTSFVV